MISKATRRSILRSIHLVLSIPILGYIYGQPAEVQPYAAAVRFVFVPVIILSGFWMYSGLSFAVIGVGVWLGTYCLLGIGAAILSQVALFIARKTWLMFRARRSPQRNGGIPRWGWRTQPRAEVSAEDSGRYRAPAQPEGHD